MREQRLTFITSSHISMVLIITSAVALITHAQASEKFLPSSYPAVDIAARELAEGRGLPDSVAEFPSGLTLPALASPSFYQKSSDGRNYSLYIEDPFRFAFGEWAYDNRAKSWSHAD